MPNTIYFFKSRFLKKFACCLRWNWFHSGPNRFFFVKSNFQNSAFWACAVTISVFFQRAGSKSNALFWHLAFGARQIARNLQRMKQEVNWQSITDVFDDFPRPDAPKQNTIVFRILCQWIIYAGLNSVSTYWQTPPPPTHPSPFSSPLQLTQHQ